MSFLFWRFDDAKSKRKLLDIVRDGISYLYYLLSEVKGLVTITTKFPLCSPPRHRRSKNTKTTTH
jgi:hypothetical protein